MLSDRDLEAILRRYEVVPPPPQLVEAVANAGRPAAGALNDWVWGPLAAAIVVAAWLTAQVRLQPAVRDTVREVEVAMVAEILGSGEHALDRAELTVPQRPDGSAGLAMVEESWLEP